MKKIWLHLSLIYGSIFLGVSLLYFFILHQVSTGPIPGHKIVWVDIFYVIVMVAIFIQVSFKLAQHLIDPIVSLSKQLDSVDIHNIKQKLYLFEQGPEIKRLIDQINNLLSEINIGLTNLNKYSAQVAHELRTPLTVIRLKIEQAIDKIDPKLAEEVQKELLRLTLHVERTLLIARAEGGHLPLHRTDFDLKTILDQITEGFLLLAAEEKREIKLKSSNVTIHADLAYTKQILYNLLSNALRHGQGIIYVRLRFSKKCVYFLVINRLKMMPVETYSLGLGNRIVKALASVHGNMYMRHKKWRNYYSVQLLVGPLGYF